MVLITTTRSRRRSGARLPSTTQNPFPRTNPNIPQTNQPRGKKSGGKLLTPRISTRKKLEEIDLPFLYILYLMLGYLFLNLKVVLISSRWRNTLDAIVFTKYNQESFGFRKMHIFILIKPPFEKKIA